MASVLNYSIHEDFSLRVGLFSQVKNAAALRKRVISGDLLGALVSPRIVAGKLHLQVAAVKAATDASRGQMKTKTIHTELLYNLFPGKSISKALQVCATADGDAWVIAAVLERAELQEGGGPKESLFDAVEGELVDFSDLARASDSQTIRELFDVQDAELLFSSLEDCVVTRLAVKGAS